MAEPSTIEGVWTQNLITSGAFENLLLKGLQYSIRHDMSSDAKEYISILTRHGLLFQDKYLEDYLYTILNKIHKGVLNDGRPGNLYINVLKNPEPNAFSLPDGGILITTGLLSTIQSEDELVAILAHEVAHFVLDHQILNYNNEIDRKQKAAFWAGFATIIAAGSDTYLSINNPNHIPGITTAAVGILAHQISSDIFEKLGAQYNRNQETHADRTTKAILQVLKYNENALAIALTRVKDYSLITGNYMALSGVDTVTLDLQVDWQIPINYPMIKCWFKNSMRKIYRW